MLDFLQTRGKFCLRAAIDDGDFRTETAGAARGVHGDVAAADYRHMLALADGRGSVGRIGFHQIGAGKEFIGGVNALEVFARDVHELGQACAGANEHSLKAVFLHQFVNGDGAADDDVGFNRNAQRLELIDLTLHNAFGQTEFGNAVY